MLEFALVPPPPAAISVAYEKH